MNVHSVIGSPSIQNLWKKHILNMIRGSSIYRIGIVELSQNVSVKNYKWDYDNGISIYIYQSESLCNSRIIQ